MENLEILGDCFLKLAVSMSLYHRYPLAGAGGLTVEKANHISNANLYRISVEKRLRPYLNVMKIVFRGKDANWLPPGYVINETEQTKFNQESGQLQRYTKQSAKRKAFADMIEAFIGAFLVSTNYAITIQFMKWLGLDVIPFDERSRIIALKFFVCFFVFFCSIELDQIMDVPSILCSYHRIDEINNIVDKFYMEYEFSHVEQTINYKFHDKAYLIAAFTHPSSFANRITCCYERYFI